MTLGSNLRCTLSIFFGCFWFCVLQLNTVEAGSARRVKEVDVLSIINGLRRLQQAADMQSLQYDVQLSNSAKQWASQCKYSASEAQSEGQAISVSGSPRTYKESLCNWARNGQAAFAKMGSDATACAADPWCRSYKRVTSAAATKVGCAISKCDLIDGYGKPGELFVCNFAMVGDISQPPFSQGASCSLCVKGQRCVEGLCVTKGMTVSTSSSTTLDQMCVADSSDPNSSSTDPMDTEDPTAAPAAPPTPQAAQGDECETESLKTFCTFAITNGYCNNPKYSAATLQTCSRTCANACPNNEPEPAPMALRCPDKHPKLCGVWRLFGGCKVRRLSQAFCADTCGYQGQCDQSGVQSLMLFSNVADEIEARELGTKECADTMQRQACQMLHHAGLCSSTNFRQSLNTICPVTCSGDSCGAGNQRTGPKRRHFLAALAGAAAAGVAGGLIQKVLHRTPKKPDPFYPQGQQQQGSQPPFYNQGSPQLEPQYNYPSQLQGGPLYGNNNAPLGSSPQFAPVNPFGIGFNQFGTSLGQFSPYQPVLPQQQNNWAYCQKAVNSRLCYSPDICFRCRLECQGQGYHC